MSINDEMEDWERESIADAEDAEQAVEGIKQARIVTMQEASTRSNEIRKEADLIKRAALLFRSGAITFPDVKTSFRAEMPVNTPLMTDENKMAVIRALFEGQEKMPHRDHFRGRIVDHEERIIDDHYPVVRWIETFSAGGLKGVSAKAAREVIKEWALEHERNDLIRYVEERMPEWDGKERMANYLLDVFECRDTPLNHDFSKYFWLSLYARVMMPGSLAPIVLSLFGAQGCGKSRFGKEIARIITGNDEADSVQLNLDGKQVDFLRDITGNSIVAAVGEMTGFTRGDMNKIKDFVTRTHDPMHQKFEGHFVQARQWITILDGNKYEGLQRDETGNRRFYPMFCGQLNDYLGKPAWLPDFRVKDHFWESLRDDVWQLMAEADEWFNQNGEGGYARFVGEVVEGVRIFSKQEMERDSGTINDDVFEVYLVPMLKDGPKFVWRDKQGRACVGIKTGEFKRYFMDRLRHVKPNWRHLKNKMTALGGTEHAFTGGYPGFMFKKFATLAEFEQNVGNDSSFMDDGEVTEVAEAKPEDGGF
jgi:hypothetical protein